MEIHVDALRAEGFRPRVHGNGFIQVDLNMWHRLHIWGHPNIPRQAVATPIHDHIFGFVSTILVGRLVNIIYELEDSPYGVFQVYQAEVRKGEDKVLMPTRRLVIPHPIKVGFCTPSRYGDSYEMESYVFHETFAPEPTATVMVKDGATQAQGANHAPPRVLVPTGGAPDNTFDRYGHDEELLWDIIEEVLTS